MGSAHFPDMWRGCCMWAGSAVGLIVGNEQLSYFQEIPSDREYVKTAATEENLDIKKFLNLWIYVYV